MSEGDIESQITIKTVMSSPVITVQLTDTLDYIATTMHSKKVGSVVVLDENLKPIGVITERDIVARVVALNKRPSEIRAVNIMSKPLYTIPSEKSITKAAQMMRKLAIRRLIVVEEGKVIGVISSDDIIKMTPELVTIIKENARLTTSYPQPRIRGLTGQCESCERWSNNLKEHDGLFMCEECLAERRV